MTNYRGDRDTQCHPTYIDFENKEEVNRRIADYLPSKLDYKIAVPYIVKSGPQEDRKDVPNQYTDIISGSRLLTARSKSIAVLTNTAPIKIFASMKNQVASRKESICRITRRLDIVAKTLVGRRKEKSKNSEKVERKNIRDSIMAVKDRIMERIPAAQKSRVIKIAEDITSYILNVGSKSIKYVSTRTSYLHSGNKTRSAKIVDFLSSLVSNPLKEFFHPIANRVTVSVVILICIPTVIVIIPIFIKYTVFAAIFSMKQLKNTAVAIGIRKLDSIKINNIR